ncbi:MAG: alpha/beta fold hydrolase [Anaerolineales bacterium]
MPHAKLDDATLYYETVGEGPPLVLIHGFALDARMWDDQVAPFAERHRLLRYDLRGFGRSSPPTAEYAHTDDLAALMHHLGLDSAHVIGLSMGGGVAADFALAYPERVRSLVLVDAALGGFPWSVDWGHISRAARADGVAAGQAAFLNDGLFEAIRALPAPWARLQQIVNDYSGFHWLNPSTERRPTHEPFTQLERLTAPILVLVGERDLPDFRRIADAIAQRAPNARNVVLPSLGHMPNMEAPERFNPLVMEFLRKQA